MQMRLLGRTGIQVSAVGYGCGGYWGLPSFPEAQAEALVHTALDGGVTFFDTGSSYSNGNAEPRLGRILAHVERSGLLIGSKAGTVFADGRLHKDYSAISLRSQVEASLRNLHMEQIPLVQLHGIPAGDPRPALEALCQLKAEGKIRLVGASCDGADLERAITSGLVDVVMLTYNLLTQHAARQIALANNHGCGILIKSPMAHTLYSSEVFKLRNRSDVWNLLRVLKNYPGQIIQGYRYKFLNQQPDINAHEAALLFALHEQASCVVIGTTNRQHLEENIHAFSRQLPQDLRARIEAA
jgi:aryl-alcohol dehydrogenase-like predicted oxidoreductase